MISFSSLISVLQLFASLISSLILLFECFYPVDLDYLYQVLVSFLVINFAFLGFFTYIFNLCSSLVDFSVINAAFFTLFFYFFPFFLTYIYIQNPSSWHICSVVIPD